jgi:hypothetical protein
LQPVTSKFQQLIDYNFAEFDFVALREILNRDAEHLQEEEFVLVELYHQLLNSAKQELVQWYQAEGYGQFTHAMAGDAAFAGDLELKILAQYWRVTFKVERKHGNNKFIYPIYGLFGQLPLAGINESEIRVLKNLKLIDRNSEAPDSLPFLEMDEATLVARCAEIEHADEVHAIWMSWHEENKNKARIHRQPIELPDDWSEPERLELFERDILEKYGNCIYFILEISEEELLRRLRPFPLAERRQQIVDLCRVHYRAAPEIRCVNDNAMHWEYLQPEGYPWQALKSAEPQRQVCIFGGVSMATLMGNNDFDALSLEEAFSTDANGAEWSSMQIDANATLMVIRQRLRIVNNISPEFSQRLMQKLQEIIDYGVITKRDASLLIDPIEYYQIFVQQ